MKTTLLFYVFIFLIVIVIIGKDNIGRKKQCFHGRTLCEEECVNLLVDNANCGECGNAAQNGQTCVNGILVNSGGGDCLGESEIKCEGICVNKSTNDNCQDCGNVCSTDIGQSCCLLEPPDYYGCIDIANDNFNCGMCGVVCDPGEACISGICT